MRAGMETVVADDSGESEYVNKTQATRVKSHFEQRKEHLKWNSGVLGAFHVHAAGYETCSERSTSWAS